MNKLGRPSRPEPRYINSGWRWWKEGSNIIIERAHERVRKPTKDNPAPDPPTVLEWTPRYFSSLENALAWAIEEDALVADHLTPFVERLRKFTADVRTFAREVQA